MELKLITNPRERKSDTEFRKTADELSRRWFNTAVPEMSLEMKTRLVPHLYRSYNTTVAQLARCISLSKEQVKDILH